MGMFGGATHVGVTWHRREDYPRVLTVMQDAHTLPATYDQWLKRAHEAIALVEREGATAVRVELDPDKFVAWCRLRGLNIDAKSRNLFGSDPANWPAGSKH